MITSITHTSKNGIITISYLDDNDFERTMTVSKDELILGLMEHYSLTNAQAIEVFEVYEDLIIENYLKGNHK